MHIAHGLGALTLFVDDPEATTAFSRDVLDLPVVFHRASPGTSPPPPETIP